MIVRILENHLSKRLFSGKAILLIGPRQVGKTTLLKSALGKSKTGVTWLNGDNPEERELLRDVTVAKWKRIIGANKIIVIDEAQRIQDIGLKMKLITDQLPDVQLIASGSSAFELANQVNEPLTGRKWQYHLYPLSFEEMENYQGFTMEHSLLHERLIYGYYPDVVTTRFDTREVLQELTESYLYRDILSWKGIRKPEKLTLLIQALAFQVGNEVSYNELSRTVGLDNQTVEEYIRLLESAYIVYRLPPLSRNLRKELKTKRKIYFYDNGIRNAVISQFQSVETRQDIGPLWENFLLAERTKYLAYHRKFVNRFFWRTTDGQEIDYVEERDGVFHAYEFKWNPKRKTKFHQSFLNAYPAHTTTVVNQDNYFDFIVGKN